MAKRTKRATAHIPESLQFLPRMLEANADFAHVLDVLKQGRAATVDGAWNSSAPLVAATLVQHTPHTLLVVLAHPRDVDPWIDDMYSFCGVPSIEFPAWESMPTSDSVLDEIGGRRLRLLRQLEGDEPPRLIVTTMQALLQPVPDREQLGKRRRRLRKGASVELEEFIGWLDEQGFQQMEAVELPGEFSRRGGILDVYSPDAEAPYRFEFLGDDIESIRQFSAETQRSLGDLQVVELTSPQVQGRSEGFNRGHFTNFLPAQTWTVLVEPDDLQEQGKYFLERMPDLTGLFSIEGANKLLVQFPSIVVTAMPTTSMETTCHLRVESVERFSGDVTKIRDELDRAAERDTVLIACHNDAERHRLGQVLAAGQLAQTDRLRLVVGQVRAGFRLVGTAADELKDAGASDSSIVVLGDHELFHRTPLPAASHGDKPGPGRRPLEARAIDSFLDLNENDLVVHLTHGIARFRGMHVLEKGTQAEEHLVLEFQGGTRVYVPASKIDLVQKYVGGSRVDPELSKLGGTSWQKRKDRVAHAVLDLASEMIDLQAARQSQAGIALPPDSDWQSDFEASFPYQETPDQLATMAEIKRDMERSRSMDRLVCGDVGYGKTELAIRAAFKAIDNGRQVAVLVPTTVLAEQHYRTFSQRLAEYPFTVETISRFRSAGEQKRIIERLATGGVDVIIGTHRLVSKDVKFKDLGLVIIDEEQRFGVDHKERLKKLRQTVDVLTLTATPIPRTLHLSLLGIREISNLETAPLGRLPIETRIIRFDEQLIRHAIVRELNREGQVYFVHNRVQDIQKVADRVQKIVPEARIIIGHGQMAEGVLEKAMLAFVRHEADILVATTIIESGLDIPNVNTIFIHQADNYGLADLHQLRGRVGRYKHRAYAYLVLDGKPISPNASRRLKAIEEFTELGAGFQIAMRDLEIRGAGNILGNQQSGHIASVGYELYCQLLESAVRQLKHLPVRTHLEVTIDLPWRAFLPRDYVAGQKQKIEVYRRLSRIRRLQRLQDFRSELRDRYGPIPEAVEWLLRLGELRLLATTWQIDSVHLEGQGRQEITHRDGTKEVVLNPAAGPIDLVLGYRNRKRMNKLARRSGSRLRIVDAQSAYFRLRPDEIEPIPLFDVIKDLLRRPETTL